MTALKTRRLILRPWRKPDLEPFAVLNADAETMEFLNGPLSRLESDALAARAEAGIEQRGWGFWAVEVQGGAPFIGLVGLSVPSFAAHFTPCVEVGWRLAREYWGHGYATEAAAESLRFAFDDLLLPEVVAFTVPANTRSRAVMERLGMSRDAADDFEHPKLPLGHSLRSHVLYRLTRETWVTHGRACV